MGTSYQNRIGSAPEEAVKAPVVTVATAAIILSGEQTINLVDVTAGQRVLVAGQANAAENGIYVADSGAWSRAKDWNDPQDLISGQLIVAPDTIYQSQYSGVYSPGVTEVNFIPYISLNTNSRVADASGDHFYTFLGEELSANRNVTLPTLLSNDTFVFEDNDQTLTNKTLSNPDINGGSIDNAVIDGRSVGNDGFKLDTIELGADANPDVIDQTDAENGTGTTASLITGERLGQAVAALETGQPNPQEADQGVAEAGTDTTPLIWSPLRIKETIQFHETGEPNPQEADQGVAEAGVDGTAMIWSPLRIKETIQFHETGEANYDLVNQGVAEAGASTTPFSWSPLRVNQAIQALAPAPIVTNAPGGATYVKKTAEEFRGNTTLADDTDLNIALLTDTVYHMSFRLAVATDGPTMRIGMRYTGNSFMAFNVINEGTTQRLHNFAGRDIFGNPTTNNLTVLIGNQLFVTVLVEGIVKTVSAGTLYLQWCQGAASGDDVYMLDSSVLEIFAP